MKIKDQKISEFLEKLASKKPTPGGGAVAAVSGALAASLVEMVCGLTKTPNLESTKIRSRKLRMELLKLADEDCTAFEKVMKAYKSKSKVGIKKALIGAFEVPQKTKKLSSEVEKLAKVAVKKGNRNAVSDAKTALYLSKAAQKSAEENIEINRRALAKLE